jgi:antigen flippase
MALAKKIVLSVGATVVNVASGLLRNKIFAAFLSLNLFGVLSLGQQSVSLVVALFSFGVPLGVTTLVAGLVNASTDERKETISRVVVLIFSTALILTIVIVAALLIDAEFISRVIVANEAHVVPLTALLFSAPFMMIQMSLFAMMEGMGMVRGIVWFKIFPALVALPLLFVLTWQYHLAGAAVGLLVSEVLLAATGLVLLRKSIALNAAAFRIKPIISSVYKVAVLSFLIGAIWFLTDFVAKRYILTSLGEVENGIVQSVAKIADLYPSVALAWLSLHLFPTIGANLGDKRIVAGALQRTTLVAVMLIVPIIITLFIFRAEVLHLVYKKEFTIGVPYFGAMLSVGIFKVLVWVVGIALLPLGLKKHWFFSGVVMTAAYAGGVWFGITAGFGVYALPAATLTGLMLQIAYIFIVYSKSDVHFDGAFWLQVAIYCCMTTLLCVSVLYPILILFVLGLYVWMLYRFDLFAEFKTKFNELRTKYAQ